MASWFRRAHAGEEPEGAPWRPPAVERWLAQRGTWDDLRYVVVDELHEGIAGLVVSPWPRTDEHGRLHFGGEQRSRRLATSAAALEEVLRAARQPVADVPVDDDAMRGRPLGIGDVFAAFVTLPGDQDDDGAPRDPRTWLRGEVLDVTAVAVEATKAQASATAAGAHGVGLLETIGAEHAEPAG